MIIDALVETKLVSDILTDIYGNYVIQKALQVSEGLRFLSIIQVRKEI